MEELLTLLNQYNYPGPRYTYYPTIKDWSNQLNVFSWHDSLKNHYNPAVGIDLYIHIPFCEVLCTFCGCNIRITQNRYEVKHYLDAIKAEWILYQAAISNNELMTVKINSIFLGGGSPNFLLPEELSELLSLFNFGGDTYKSIELDPRKTSNEYLTILKDYNFDYLSFGVQDTNPQVLQNVNRETSYADLQKLMTKAHEMAFPHINLDLIYGLPFQSNQTLKQTINDVCSLAPDSIALYPFARVPWQNNSQQVSGIFSEVTREEMNAFLITCNQEILKNETFSFLGMGHFYRKTSLNKPYRRNIMGFSFSKESSLLIGLGVSAISSSPDGLIQNEKIIEKYQYEINQSRAPIFKSHLKNQREAKLEKVFERIISSGIISSELVMNKDLFQQYREMGFFEKYSNDDDNNELFKITKFGRYFLKNICQTFE